MPKTPPKWLLISLLIILFSSQAVHAQKNFYQSGGNMPFIQMMMSMMAALGMLNRVPANSHGSFAQSDFSNPYMRALTMQGLPPGAMHTDMANNPFVRSPWLHAPWSAGALSNTGVNNVSPLWGTPSWGVLPTARYGPGGSNAAPPATVSAWSSSELEGWVNEPWEASSWNPNAIEGSARQEKVQDQSVQSSAAYSSVQTGAMHSEQQAMPQQPARPSPLSKLVQNSRTPEQQVGQVRQAGREPASATARQQRTPPPMHKNIMQSPRQQPCVTEFCGLKRPNLNGLWVAKNGEMFGVKNKRYLWSDGKKRHLTGQLLIQNEYLLASVDGHKKTMRFKYKLAGNHLLTMQPDGVIREFVRMPANQLARQW